MFNFLMKFLLNETVGIISPFFLLVLFTTTIHQEIKATLFILALTFCAMLMSQLKIVWPRRLLLGLFSLATFVMLESLHGVINSIDGAVLVLNK
jgi:hypothetical protein